MRQSEYKKTLAAILHADVAGYGRLTDQDEEATHRTLSLYLDVVSELIGSGGGEVLHFAGDAVLASFPSAIAALSCAVQIQKEISDRNQQVPRESQVQFRIGVNVGDVIRDRNEVYGNGVNAAARLEAMAEPGGICISEAVFDSIGAKLPLQYRFLGKKQVKHISHPIRVYAVVIDAPDDTSMRRLASGRGLFAGGLAALGLAAAVGAWLFVQPADEPAPGLELGAPLTYESLIQSLPATEKGIFKYKGEWAWFAEYYSVGERGSGDKKLRGFWGYIENVAPREEYLGDWSMPAPIDGTARHCTAYYPDKVRNCYRYRPLVATVGDTRPSLYVRFDEAGNCDGISYFEPGDTTTDPKPRETLDLMALARACLPLGWK